MPIPRPEPLQFPRGARFPRADEFPAGHDDQIRRIATARITTGYTIEHHADGPFAAHLKANVHASRLWELFRALAEGLMPAVAAPIVGINDCDPVLGPYTERIEAIAVFMPYTEALQHDGFLEFGIMFQDQERTHEIFVTSTKVMHIWTSSPGSARTVLQAQGIPELPELDFLENYARVSETLSLDGHSDSCTTVLERLKLDFDDLPRR